MKTLIVTTDGGVDTYELSNAARLFCIDGCLSCDDEDNGNCIIYAPGTFLSAHLDTIPEV